MTAKCRILLIASVVFAFAVITAVCLHSLEEIHYLKGFFPATFTVQEAFYAGALELVKVAIIALPLVLLIGICLFCLRAGNKP